MSKSNYGEPLVPGQGPHTNPDEIDRDPEGRLANYGDLLECLPELHTAMKRYALKVDGTISRINGPESLRDKATGLVSTSTMTTVQDKNIGPPAGQY